MSLGHALGPYATLNTFHDMRQKILFFCSALFMENYNMLTLFQADCTISLLGDRCRRLVCSGSHVGGLQPYLPYST